MPPELLSQFPMLEDALTATGFTVWPMVELEADDAMAAAAAVAGATAGVDRVFICTPDKDLGQCVDDHRHVVQFDRRAGRLIDEAGVRERFGVGPASIPDYLALVGDSADGFPGLPGWGAKSAATVLARYEHLDAIPDDAARWDVTVRGAPKLAATLAAAREAANLFLDLATLRTTAEVGAVDEWRWRGPSTELAGWAARFGVPSLVTRANRLAEGRES
jgi:5'-3' exonuclease